MDFLIAEIVSHILDNYRGRKIVLWGKYSVSERIKEVLSDEYGIAEVCYIDRDETIVDNREVFPISYISGKKTDIYIAIPLAVHESVKESLRNEGYKPEADYYYFSDCAVKMTEDYYEDAHGNRCIGKRDNLRFCFSGRNATILIGKNVKCTKKYPIYMHSDSSLMVGDDSDIADSSISIMDNGRAHIGSHVQLANYHLGILDGAELIVKDHVSGVTHANSFQQIILSKHGKVVIGEATTIRFGIHLECCQNTEIIIGDDCMLSSNVWFLSNDWHTIFDVRSKKAVNISRESNKRRIEIGDHVWVGGGCYDFV